MSKKILATTMTAFALCMGAVSAPARADQGDLDFNKIFAMADADRNGMVNKKEFMEAMSKAFDMKMAKMKTMKDSSMMMKGDAMTKDGFKSFLNDIHSGS